MFGDARRLSQDHRDAAAGGAPDDDSAMQRLLTASGLKPSQRRKLCDVDTISVHFLQHLWRRSRETR